MKPTSCIGEANHGSTRWHIDAATLAVLEKVFSLDQFPNVETRKQLGTELGVSTRQIQVWFQNRRQRERKNKAASNSSLEIMPSKTTTPVSSTDDITTALFEFGTADKDENKSLGGLPLAPMPRMNSPTSSSGSSSPGRDAQLAKRSTAAARPAKDGAAALRPGEAELPPPIDEAPPLKRPEALLAGAGAGFAKPYLPGATASISSWTPPTLPTSGGPAANPLRGLGAPSLADTAPNVASKLAEACQSSLIGRTLQDYGGIVQVITEPRAPFNVLSVSSGWERLSGCAAPLPERSPAARARALWTPSAPYSCRAGSRGQGRPKLAPNLLWTGLPKPSRIRGRPPTFTPRPPLPPRQVHAGRGGGAAAQGAAGAAD